MTRKEAIERLEWLKETCHGLATRTPSWQRWALQEAALNMALTALRFPTREMVEKVWRGCYTCDEYKYFMFNAWTNPESSERPDCMGTSLFCPHCGKPLTDEAVDMMLERWKEAVNYEG